MNAIKETNDQDVEMVKTRLEVHTNRKVETDSNRISILARTG